MSFIFPFFSFLIIHYALAMKYKQALLSYYISLIEIKGFHHETKFSDIVSCSDSAKHSTCLLTYLTFALFMASDF